MQAVKRSSTSRRAQAGGAPEGRARPASLRALLAGRALATLALAMPALALAQAAQGTHAEHDASGGVSGSPLIDKVRGATAQWLDVNAAIRDHWVPATPCVSGPNAGAMGVHFLLPSRLDGKVVPGEPEALIYEPMRNGALRLVGVEYIVKVQDWEAAHPEGGVPQVDGHLMNRVEFPNRYGLPAFYELHVWAWERNPGGSFADWNTRVSCDSQPGDPSAM